VTGSGKTEVYLHAVERALELGKGALVLVPEIALTPQLVGRFTTRFGPTVAVLHSGLKDRERLLHFQRLRRGEARIAVGVRSAVFAPVPDLGVIVVDEEHDPSFKQDEKLRYQARDLAVVRGKQCGALVVLGSATPSLETLHNANTGRYRKLVLGARVDDRPMPQVGIVDLRTERPRFRDDGGEPPILAPASLAALEETLARGQQAILFLNRRGHATFLLCQACGESLRCDACDVSLTLHLSRRRLLCHYCGALRDVPRHCPACDGPLIPLGVGTERVEGEVEERFPNARVARLDRDVATSAEKLTDLLAAFARREIDVLVGTQMVAKGHDFPGVTLVLVVLADTSLSLPDFRAGERTFQLLTQVAGRAGRGKEPGRVLVQTYHPDADPVRHVLDHDFEAFSTQELRWRKQTAYPPFSRMAGVRIESADAGLAERTARALAQAAARRMPPPEQGVRLLGPAPAAIARIQGKTRWQLLLKAPTHGLLAGPLTALEEEARLAPRSVRVVVDVDPGAML
jgi:primosomal protein N' (replication factor Y)